MAALFTVVPSGGAGGRQTLADVLTLGAVAGGTEIVADGGIAAPVTGHDHSTNFGTGNTLTGSWVTICGKDSFATDDQTTAFGYWAEARGNSSTAFGSTSWAFSDRSVAIGVGAVTSKWADYNFGRWNLAIGYGPFAQNDRAIAIGYQANALENDGLCIGYQAQVLATHTGSIALGRGTDTSAARQFIAGSANAQISTVCFGNGATASTPSGFTLHGTDAATSQTDRAGANVTIRPGNGTGAAAGAQLLLQTPTAIGSGTTAQTPTTRVTVDEDAVDCAVPVGLPSYAKAGLPSAAVAGRMIYVTDDVGGAVPAFSDGANWRRVTDLNVIS